MIWLSPRSETALKGVHPDLVRVVRSAYSQMTGELSFIVTEGLRTKARQELLYQQGATQTMNSRHLTGHAVDLAATINGKVRWDWPLYNRLADYMKEAAVYEKVPIVWGGDWKTFKDGPHFELNRKKYP